MAKKQLIIGLVLALVILATAIVIWVIADHSGNEPEVADDPTVTTETDEPGTGEETTDDVEPPKPVDDQPVPTPEKDLSFNILDYQKNPEPGVVGDSVEYGTKE